MHDFNHCHLMVVFLRVNKSKDVKIILEISKKLAIKLNKEYKVPFGENGISTSKTSHKKYYICESKRNKDLLAKLSN